MASLPRYRSTIRSRCAQEKLLQAQGVDVRCECIEFGHRIEPNGRQR